MRLSKKHRPETPSVNMTPMIDIVFLLIIFFMTVSQIAQIKRAPLQLPQLSLQGDQELSAFTVNLDQNGQVSVGGQDLSLADLSAAIQLEIDRQGDDQFRAVVLRTDQRCDSSHVNQVVKLLAQAGIDAVRVAVEDL